MDAMLFFFSLFVASYIQYGKFAQISVQNIYTVCLYLYNIFIIFVRLFKRQSVERASQ